MDLAKFILLKELNSKISTLKMIKSRKNQLKTQIFHHNRGVNLLGIFVLVIFFLELKSTQE
jgi:hypothetical protein